MDYWALIVAMLAVTFATRFSLFAFAHLQFPAPLQRALRYVPSAVLSALVVPGMVAPNGQWALTLDNAYLWAGLGCILLAGFTRHLLATIGGGLLLFFALRAAFGQLPI